MFSSMIALIVAVVRCFLGYAYPSLRAPPPKICGSPGGPSVTSPRIKLSDGRHLAYKDREGCFKRRNQERIKELQIYILSFDRAGYGESNPNPKRSIQSEAFDIQELVDGLQLVPKFYLIGMSIGAYPVYGCLKYIPHNYATFCILLMSSVSCPDKSWPGKLSGAALVVPFVNYWWRCFPAPFIKRRLRDDACTRSMDISICSMDVVVVDDSKMVPLDEYHGRKDGHFQPLRPRYYKTVVLSSNGESTATRCIRVFASRQDDRIWEIRNGTLIPWISPILFQTKRALFIFGKDMKIR